MFGLWYNQNVLIYEPYNSYTSEPAVNYNSVDVYQTTAPASDGTRTGAVCNDGSTSTATGRGACSRHGGVQYWLTNQLLKKCLIFSFCDIIKADKPFQR